MSGAKLRLAYVVDGPMARGVTGSGHHIRNFYRHLRRLGVDVAGFDARTGLPLKLDRTPPPRKRSTPRARLSSRLSAMLPESLERSLAEVRRRRIARGYLRDVGAFPAEAFRSLETFAPDFVLHRMVHANTFAFHAWRRTGIPYGLECNAPILFQKRRYETLVAADECRAREALVLEAARFATFVSRATAELCRESPGYRRLPCYVIWNGADDAFFRAPRETRQAARAALGVSANETLVAYVGSLKSWHRLDLLLAAAARLARERVRFLVVGSGPGARRLRARAASAGLGERIRFTGSVPNEEVPRYLAAADIGLQPGSTEYAAPLKLVEYMASGTAVVAPRLPAIEEIAVDGTNALLFDPGDAEGLVERLARLHREPDARRRLAERARADAQTLTWANNARSFVRVIERHRGAGSGGPLV